MQLLSTPSRENRTRRGHLLCCVFGCTCRWFQMATRFRTSILKALNFQNLAFKKQRFLASINPKIRPLVLP
jgi:hypothetical protein